MNLNEKKAKKGIDRLKSKKSISKPLFFDLSKKKDLALLNASFKKNDIGNIVDDYKEQLFELFAINNPTKVFLPNFKEEFDLHFKSLVNDKPLWQQGKWVLFPWNFTLVHILADNDFQIVRTARNKNLINAQEQKNFYDSTIGIAGLSVGSSVAFAIALQGGGKHFKLADMDSLALSNTNRILTGIDSLGLHKVEMAARKIYELNPYATVNLFKDGISSKNIKSFFKGLDIVIDELDNLAVKYLIREEAKNNRIAVVMAADNGDNAVVDIERYDIDDKTQYFHGRMGEITYDFLTKLDKFGIGRHIAKHIGPENITEKTFLSFLEMGKSIVSWPQLGGAAMINGAAVAYCVRKILNKQPLQHNRALISLDEKLDPEFDTEDSKNKRQKIAGDIINILKI